MRNAEWAVIELHKNMTRQVMHCTVHWLSCMYLRCAASQCVIDVDLAAMEAQLLGTAANLKPGWDVAERVRLCMHTGRQFIKKHGLKALYVDKKADEPHTGFYKQATGDLKQSMRSHGFKAYGTLMPFPGKPSPLW